MNSKPSKPLGAMEWAVIALLLLGAGLRIFEYGAKSSFWGDEMSVISNITTKGMLDLATQPLAEDQMAPVGFVLCLKAVVGLAGTSEWSFRLIPLLATLLALPLFAGLSRRILASEASLLAIGAFALSPPLIRYAAQVKPYSSDVAICLLCLLAADLWLTEGSRRNTACLCTTGAVAIWFSYPAFFILTAIGFAALFLCATQRSSKQIRYTGTIFVSWIVSAGALAAIERHRFQPNTHSFMLEFWANWLMPRVLNWQNIRAYLVSISGDCLSYFLHVPKWRAFLLLLVFGVVYLLRRSQGAWLIVLPIALTLAASMLRIYPFSGRLILFLVPNIYVALAAGVEAIVKIVLHFGDMQKIRTPLVWAVFSAAAIALCLKPLWAAPPPYRNSETRPVISYLGAHYQKGDAIYVDAMAWGAYTFYGPRSGLRIDEAIRTSHASPTAGGGVNPLHELADIDQFRGRSRVWILFGGGYPVIASCALRYLNSIGAQLDHRSAFDASVYLYDLSNPERFRYATAEDFFSHSSSDAACFFQTTNPVGPQQ